MGYVHVDVLLLRSETISSVAVLPLSTAFRWGRGYAELGPLEMGASAVGRVPPIVGCRPPLLRLRAAVSEDSAGSGNGSGDRIMKKDEGGREKLVYA